MKTNKTTIVFIILLLIVGVLLVRGGGQSEPDTPSATTTQSTSSSASGTSSAVSVSGEITSIDASQAAMDGPYVISLRTAADNQVTVEVPSMGIRQCTASSSIASIDKLAVGQQVAVSGTRDGDAIVPCESATHYLRIEESPTTSPVGN